MQVDGAEQLLELKREAHRRSLSNEVIHDEGRTEIEPGTATVLAVGPSPEADVNEVTGHLNLLSDRTRELGKENSKLLKRGESLEHQLTTAKLKLFSIKQNIADSER